MSCDRYDCMFGSDTGKPFCGITGKKGGQMEEVMASLSIVVEGDWRWR